MDSSTTALIGVLGTLAGTILGWFLNSWAYKLGRTNIYATLVSQISIPPLVLDNSKEARRAPPKTEYSFHCVATNSRQIPVYLENFHGEVQQGRDKPVEKLFVYEPELSYTEIGKGKIAARLALGRKIIPPRTLYEFSFSMGACDPEIEYSKIVLVAFDERHRRQKFLLHDGRKIKRPPAPPANTNSLTPQPGSDCTGSDSC